MKNPSYSKTLTANCKPKTVRFLITTGPTQEPLDPVRFISNYSTGTMGYVLAREAQRQGYKVTLISGPTHLRPPEGVRLIFVTTAEEMYEAVKKQFRKSDCLIMTAAVCDFKPLKFSGSKIDKEGFGKLELEKTTDILYEMGKIKGQKILIGFALESENLIKNAREKLRKKKLDLIVAQKLSRNRIPFGKTKVSPILIHRNGSGQKIPPCSKSQLARIIFREVSKVIK
jgi:phosphopantothenoylcysteine decarboxylase/phosphopantothenate--cysteine ligase